MDVIKYFPRKTSHFTPRARTYQPPRAMDCCDDEPCRTVRGGPFSLPEKRNSIPGSSSGRLQPVPLGDVTNANPSLRAPPDRASRPAAAAVTGASQSDGPKWIIPGIWKWTSPEEKKDHRAAREIGWTEKRQKGWSDNFTEEERELVHRRFDAEDVLDAIFKSPVCRKSFEKEWGDVTTVYIQRIVDQSREANHPKNAACANIIQGNFLAAFDCCLNPVLEAFGRDRITSPCALDATVEYLREHLDPKNPRIIHGISVCARGGGGGEVLANHADAPPQYAEIHRAFEETSPGAVFFDLPCNPFTCAPQAVQKYHCGRGSAGGKWFSGRFLNSWAGSCQNELGLKIVAVALIGENTVLSYRSRNDIAEELGVDAGIVTSVPHYFYLYNGGVMQAGLLRLGVLKIKAIVADGLKEGEERELEKLSSSTTKKKDAATTKKKEEALAAKDAATKKKKEEATKKKNEEALAGGEGKSRLTWTRELHKRFVDAVNRLGGAELASPKGITELMDVDGMTSPARPFPPAAVQAAGPGRAGRV